ncbi:MAG: hypothetical protein ABJE47_22280 [bacterium]
MYSTTALSFQVSSARRWRPRLFLERSTALLCLLALFIGCGGTGTDVGPIGTTGPPSSFVADSAAVSFSFPAAGGTGTRLVNISHSGSPVTGLGLSLASASGAAPSWLTAQLSAARTPAVLTLAVNAAGLLPGTYHATARVASAGASNSPLVIDVTVVVAPPDPLVYGAAAEKVKVVDVGATFAPMVAADGSGTPTTAPLTFVSRAASVATVGTDGRITGVGGGDAWIVGSSPSSRDSVFVIVPRLPNGPVFRTDVGNSTARAGDTLFLNVVLDTRGVSVGAATLVVGVTLETGAVTALHALPATAVLPVVNVTQGPVYRISVGAANGMTGSVQLLQLKIVGRVSPTLGWLTLTALDVAGIDGSNLTTQTSSTRIPLVYR